MLTIEECDVFERFQQNLWITVRMDKEGWKEMMEMWLNHPRAIRAVLEGGNPDRRDFRFDKKLRKWVAV